MTRVARPHTPGFPHHLISRFQDRRFRLAGPRERAGYLESLRRASKAHPSIWICSYGGMSSHVHKVCLGENEPLGGFLHSLNTSFGLWLNKNDGGLGKVFAERPSSIPITTDEGLARAIAYIHNNPVRAGVVVCPSDTDWTSHRAFIGEAEPPGWLEVEWALAAIGYSSTPSGRAAFHDFVVSRSRFPRDPSISGPGVSDVAVARRLLAACASYFGMLPDELAQPVFADGFVRRLSFVSVAKSVFGLSNRHIADVLGVSPPLVCRLVRRAKADPAVTQALLDAYLEYESSDSE